MAFDVIARLPNIAYQTLCTQQCKKIRDDGGINGIEGREIAVTRATPIAYFEHELFRLLDTLGCCDIADTFVRVFSVLHSSINTHNAKIERERDREREGSMARKGEGVCGDGERRSTSNAPTKTGSPSSRELVEVTVR